MSIRGKKSHLLFFCYVPHGIRSRLVNRLWKQRQLNGQKRVLSKDLKPGCILSGKIIEILHSSSNLKIFGNADENKRKQR